MTLIGRGKSGRFVLPWYARLGFALPQRIVKTGILSRNNCLGNNVAKLFPGWRLGCVFYIDGNVAVFVGNGIPVLLVRKGLQIPRELSLMNIGTVTQHLTCFT